MRVSFPTRIGRSRLSTNPITSTPQTTSAMPCQSAPVAKKYRATGSHTSPAPTAGTSDRKAISTAHSKAPLTSRNQKASPPSAPWIAATSRLPFTVARITVVNLLTRSCFCACASGIARRTARATASPSRIRKNARYMVMKRPTMNSNVFWPIASACVAINWLACDSAAASRRRRVSKSASPKRSKSALIQGGNASNTSWKYCPACISPDSRRWYTSAASRASAAVSSTSGRITMISTIRSVISAAQRRRPLSLGSSRRFKGANNKAMIAPHMMVP